MVGLASKARIDLLESQVRRFRPSLVACFDEEKAEVLKKRLEGLEVEVCSGLEGLIRVASMEEAHLVISATVGAIGLLPLLKAIEGGKNILLANKEPLAIAGQLITSKAKEKGVAIIPLDSEHSAIFQCLKGNSSEEVERIILTASGGPFFRYEQEALQRVTPDEALKHPIWEMGSKITIDSATLMNKGLEVLEAKWLFGVEEERIEVLIHPESVVHAMVEFIDGSTLALLSAADMRLPIHYALTHPRRLKNPWPRLTFEQLSNLHFHKPDLERFPCLSLAYRALREKGTMPAVLNGANEVVVNAFLQRKIGFMDIPKFIEQIMERHHVKQDLCLEVILEADTWARNQGEALVASL